MAADLTLPPCVVLTVDVEWAHEHVLADVVSALDERGLRATFFCTHAGISVPGHEVAVHPNFRRLAGSSPVGDGGLPHERDLDAYRRVIADVRALDADAVGVRAHHLFHESALLRLYADAGFEYTSTCFLPLTEGLRPVPTAAGMLELPIFYMDHWDLLEQRTGFALHGLRLDDPGLKVLDFHPVPVYANAADAADYARAKEHYHDPAWLRRHRRRGRGARTLFLEVLDWLAAGPAPPVLGELNRGWRARQPVQASGVGGRA
jgi:hypothetical protein